ncbi:MAG: OFA family MFS transporter [Lachnospiraceae bacterium]|nr:OFA family MFS transporter [Lachnospiraceae bacterium]
MQTVEKRSVQLSRQRWIILAVSCLMNLCIGSMYAWSVLAAPMAEELHVPDLSIVFSTANAVGFITMIIGGILNDRYGPRWVVFAGGVMFGLGMFSCGFAGNTGDLILSYGLMLGLGLSLVYGCTIGNTVKFFPDRKGMAGGATTAFYGISSVLFAPVANALNDIVGVRAAFRILGTVFLFMLCLGSFFMHKCPEDFTPSGDTRHASACRRKAGEKTPLEMLHMPVFYIMLLMLVCGGSFGMMIISSAKSMGVRMTGVSAAAASLLVSVLCLSNTAGRLIAGMLSDRFGRIHTLTAAMLTALAGLAALFRADISGSVFLFAVGLILTGSCFGTFMGVFPGFCTDQFGMRYNTVNYGIMWIGFSLAGVIGPAALRMAYGAFGTYRMAFAAAMLLLLIGLICVFVYHVLTKRGPGIS